MIATWRSGCLIVQLVVAQACSYGTNDPAQYVGTWTRESATQSDMTGIALILRENQSFEATGFPASLVCPAARNIKGVTGSGTWRLTAEMHRIDLNFQELSDASCTVPYLANVFPERGFESVVIVAYPNGVDSMSTAIRFKRTE